jgi:hypothetical protein
MLGWLTWGSVRLPGSVQRLAGGLCEKLTIDKIVVQVAQARKVHRHEWWLLLRITGMLFLLPLLHTILTLPALLHWCDARVVALPCVTPSRLLALVHGVCQQHIGIFRPNCVTQSLVLFHFLRQWGYPAQVHFGVVKHERTLAGHCWLELDGQPFAEPAEPRDVFTIVYSYPERDPALRRITHEQ